MDPKIASRFNDTLLKDAMQRYDIPADKIKLLNGFESFIYEFNRPDGDFILRIGHSLRRTPDMIRGEVDWINYLADGGTTVARAVLSSSGNLVEPVDDGEGGQFLCTAFVKARGITAGREQMNETPVPELRPPAGAHAQACQSLYPCQPCLEALRLGLPGEQHPRPAVACRG